MAHYLVTYHGGGMPQEPAAMAEARDAFIRWAQKTGPALADPGAPVAAVKVVSSSGISDGAAAQGGVSGWSVLEAPDLETACTLVRDHPFIGRGGNLQVNEPVAF